MFNMNKVMDEAGADPASEVVNFRMTKEDKEYLVEFCRQHNLSVGKVIRSLVKQFIEATK